ncbi:hypothetical protein GGH96_005615 [Coemansia sp. RSA 1972]|nr:hypothetical protein GGH96_005615 [Coemansia sp. RSA 1972]
MPPPVAGHSMVKASIHVYRLGDSQGELQPISEWTSLSLEASAAKLIALPGSNVLVAGDESLSKWIDTDSYERLLLDDEEGVLSLQLSMAALPDQRTSQAFGFLDGDLIEQFLDLSRETQQLVFSGGSVLIFSKAVAEAEHQMKSEFWASFSHVEAEGDVAVFSQMAVSDIGQREDVSLDYVVRLVESLTRLH